MRSITYCIAAAALFAVPFSGSAQDAGSLQDQAGYTVSRETGALSKLLPPKLFDAHRQDVHIYDPQLRLMSQLGIRQEMHTRADEYEFYGGTAYKGNNVPFASVTDAQGNTYVTGGSSNTGHPAGDWLTIKVDATGAIIWEQREPAGKYAVEMGMEIMLDNNGDLVVAGIEWNGNDMDIRVIKYNAADGNKAWQKTYAGPGDGVDVPSAIAPDTHGNILVACISYSGNSVDYVVLKYSGTGNQEWVARNSGPGAGSWNEATALATDSNDNVIVTGYSPNPDGWLNYHTVKYNSSGEEQWVQAYNYPSTDPENPMDVTNSTPRAVTTDGDGNIYVTGMFDTFLGRFGTIKYDAAGEQQWIATYKSGTEKTIGSKIAIQDGVLYVAGTHIGGFADDGTVLAAYDLDGTELWVKETTDLIDAIDTALMFDTDGNPVVAAFGMAPGADEWTQDTAVWATRYDIDGNETGEAAFVIPNTGYANVAELPGAGLDSSGTIYFATNCFYTELGSVFEIVRSGFAATAPEPSWNTRYSNQGSPNVNMLYTFSDHNGGTLATGTYYTFANEMLNATYFIVKYNADGSIAWEAPYNEANGNLANGIIGRADRNGNIFVALLPDFGQTVITVKKLSPAGAELWETEVELTNPVVYVMEPGADGSLYLGGSAWENDAAANASFVGIKLSADGEQLWKTFTPSSNAGDNVYDISGGKVTAGGELVLTGMAGTGGMMSQDVSLNVVKFNADGTSAWVTPVPFEGLNSSGTDLLIADDGSIYTNGFAKSPVELEEDIVTVKLSAAGEVLWARRFGDPDWLERSYTIQQFSNGDVGVVGYSLADLTVDIHNVLLRYDAAGNEVWDFASENMRYYNGFHIDGSDNCYIMDQMIIDPFPHKIYHAPFPTPTLIKVDGSGNGQEEFFVGPEYAEFFGAALVPHADDRLLMGGHVSNQVYYEGLYFIETAHDGSNLGTGEHGHTANGSLLGQNYPNPVSGVTEIPFYLADGGKATIKLYSTSGRLIREIASDTFAPGQNTIQFNAAGLAEGIYFYQITAGKFKQARKMVVARQ